MVKRNDPKIKAAGKGKKDYTKIIFEPDLEKFGMTSLDEDTVSLFTKRVYVVLAESIPCIVHSLNLSNTTGTTWQVSRTNLSACT